MTSLVRFNAGGLNERVLRRTGAFAAAALAGMMAFTASGQAQGQAPRFLAPGTDFSKICAPLAQARLTRDWTKWDKSQPVADPEEMYNAAILYAEGSPNVTRDPLTARKLFEDLADRPWPGRGRAHYRLARLLLDPVAGPVDPERAASHLTTAVSMLNMDAAVLLGKLHEDGRIANASVAEAERLYRAASATGDIGGIVSLAHLQRSGRVGDVPQSTTGDLINLALQTLYDELGQGKCNALFEIGSVLSDETLVPGGLGQAEKWFQASARQGDPRGNMALAELYMQGRLKATPDMVIGNLTRAAEAGVPRAMTVLGERLLLGDGAPKDTPKAISWLERAGTNADPEGYKLLARHYRGEFGDAPDLPKAADALTRAIALPGRTASLVVGLARLNVIGIHGQPDIETALKLYRQAADMGDVGSLTDMAKLLIAQPQAASRSAEILRLLKDAADHGSPEAMGVLSDLYSCSAVVSPDSEQAKAWLTRAAAAGHVPSINTIALRSNGDPAVARRNAAALQWAAERGDRESMVLLSYAYRSGQGVDTDEKAADHWREAALAPGDGQARALVLMARKMLNGDGGVRDEAGARALLDQAAQKGDADAQLELGRLLVTGRNKSGGDVQKGVQLLQKSAASGNAAAMVALADLSGDQLQPTGRTALEWRKAAADTGSSRAAITLASTADDADVAQWIARAESLPVCAARDMADLATVYHKLPGDKDEDRARLWLQKALSNVQSGEQDPAALFAIGRAMMEGVGGPADKQEALAYIRQAADAGRVDAMRYLARGYASGKIGEVNTKLAIEWFTKSLRSGDPSAAGDLARLAATGEGMAAIAPLKESAESGFPSAMREYGRSLQLGFGIPMEPEKGAAWLLKAAEAGDTGAMKELSRAYASGYGVELSARDSTEWLQRAAKAGDPEAMYSLGLAMTIGFGTEVDTDAAQEWMKTAEGTVRKK